MPNIKKDYATVDLDPVKDPVTGLQVNDFKKGEKWKITVNLPKRGEQKRPRRSKTVYGTKAFAEREKDKFFNQINLELCSKTIPSNFEIQKSNLCFGDCLKTWLSTNQNNHTLARRTWESYQGYATKHVLPLLAHVQITEIAPYHISRYKEIKLEEGLSPSSVNKHISLISDVLEDASSPEKQLIGYNPAVLIKRAKNKKGANYHAAVNCLNTSEVTKFLELLKSIYSLRNTAKKDFTPQIIEQLKVAGYTDDELKSSKALFKLKASMLYPIVFIVSRTGLRLSEALALKWQNIDFDQREILVYETSHFGTKEYGERHHLNSTKEGRVKPFIQLGKTDIEFLKLWKLEQTKQKLRYEGTYSDNDLVFASKDGGYLQNTAVSKEFTSFARANGFDNFTFHGLRHTHCTLLLAAGVPVFYVARRVGHQSPSTTSNIYSHAEKVQGDNLGDVFENVLSKGDFGKDRLVEAHHLAKDII